MTTDVLWTPHRLGYLRGLKRARKTGHAMPCFLCQALRSRRDRESHLVERGRHAFCILNKYPYNIGHIMIVPNRHTADYPGLTAAELSEMGRMTQAYLRMLSRRFDPDGFNLGVNLGSAAGAGLETHLHLHIVPRWRSDTNFFNILGGARVISMTLDDLYDALARRPGRAR
jgi:ATP adenylyltransferase